MTFRYYDLHSRNYISGNTYYSLESKAHALSFCLFMILEFELPSTIKRVIYIYIVYVTSILAGCHSQALVYELRKYDQIKCILLYLFFSRPLISSKTTSQDRRTLNSLLYTDFLANDHIKMYISNPTRHCNAIRFHRNP